MASEQTPWEPLHEREEEEEPFVTLLAEARAALNTPGASVEDIKRKYRRAVSLGAAHLDVPSLEAVADEIARVDIPAVDYDDGPFADTAPVEVPKVVRRPSRRPRPVRKVAPPPAPKPTAVERMLKLLGR